LVSAVLSQPIPIIIFSIDWQPILKRPSFSYRINGIGLEGRYQRYLTSRYYKHILL
jgi:hypothetical protein